MEDEKVLEKVYSAWLDKENRIVSFRKEDGFEKVQFPTRDEMFQFVIEKSTSGFRIQ